MLLGRSSVGRGLLDADGIAGDDEVDASVLRATARCGVIRDWFGFSVASGGDVGCLNSLSDEEVPDGVRPVLRELLVVFVAAYAVGVAFDLNLEAGVGLKDSGDLGEADLSSRLQSVPGGVEEDVRHIDDEAACRFAGCEDAVELAAKLFADGIGVVCAAVRLGGTGASVCGFGLGAGAVCVSLGLGCLGALCLELRLLRL